MTAASSLGTRSISLAVGLFTLPLALRYLGPDQYGLWVTIISFTSLLVFADLGLSQGLVNGVSEADGRGDRETASQLVASAFALLVALAAVLGASFALVHPMISWGSVFNVTSVEASGAADRAVAVLVVVTLIGLPLGVAERVRFAFQEGYIADAWLAVGNLVSLAGLVLAVFVEASLAWLVLAISIGPVLAAALNGMSVLRGRRWLAPAVSKVTLSAGRRMLGLGLLFFVIQTSAAVAFFSDNLVIARILGVEAVTHYAVPMKLFAFIPAVIGFGLYPLWPAYREALARGDWAWFTRAATRSFRWSTAAGVVLSAVLAVIATPVIHVWAGGDVTPTRSLLIALGAHSALMTVATAQAVFFYATDTLGFFAAVLVVMVVVNLGSSIVLTRSIGVPGPAWGSVIGLSIVVVASWLQIRHSIRDLSRWERADGGAVAR
ncbi:MAG: hypothetical protein HKN44_13280 [Ilumatobacter sp.]|nr:hypothetical protein [Ilumatobacter sp.]